MGCSASALCKKEDSDDTTSRPENLEAVADGILKLKAIVDGLKNSISDFTSNEQIKGASSKDVVDLLLITQYFDMLNAIGTRPDTQTVFIDEDGE